MVLHWLPLLKRHTYRATHRRILEFCLVPVTTSAVNVLERTHRAGGNVHVVPGSKELCIYKTIRLHII